MTNILQSYWLFLNRPSSALSVTTGFDSLPNFLRDTALFTALFSLVFLLVNPLLSAFFLRKFNDFPPRKKKELPSYVLCLVHHIVAVPFAWRNIINDINLEDEAAAMVDYAPITAIIAPWCIAYLVTDTMFFAVPEALAGKFEYIIHHFLTLFLVTSSLFAPGSILRFIPHLLISDTTNIFFNTAWLLRLFGGKRTFALIFLEVSFAVSFLLIRAINMPCMFWALGSQAKGLGVARYALVPIAFMQWYWLFKIMGTIAARFKADAPLAKSSPPKKTV
jgi:TLC domain